MKLYCHPARLWLPDWAMCGDCPKFQDILWYGDLDTRWCPHCYDWNRITHSCKHINGLVQDCSISIALAMEILQSCTKAISIINGLLPNATKPLLEAMLNNHQCGFHLRAISQVMLKISIFDRILKAAYFYWLRRSDAYMHRQSNHHRFR